MAIAVNERSPLLSSKRTGECAFNIEATVSIRFFLVQRRERQRQSCDWPSALVLLLVTQTFSSRMCKANEMPDVSNPADIIEWILFDESTRSSLLFRKLPLIVIFFVGRLVLDLASIGATSLSNNRFWRRKNDKLKIIYRVRRNSSATIVLWWNPFIVDMPKKCYLVISINPFAHNFS